MNDKKRFPTLETARLCLRQFQEKDAKRLLAITQDEEVMRYYGMEPFASEKESLEEINWFNDQFEKMKGIRWVITLKPQDEYIGDIGFGYVARHARADLGYKLMRAYWRQGITKEAAQRVIAFSIEVYNINRFEAMTDPRNMGNVGFLEALGFQKEGILREYEFEKGAFIDLVMYSLLKCKYLSQ